MVEVKTKIGPKGQVVIPKIFRDEYRMVPGSIVAFQEKEGNLVVRKAEDIDVVKAYEQIAKSIGKRKFDLHAIEKESEARWEKAK